MSLPLIIALIVFSLVLVLLVSLLVVKGKIPIKYSLLWYFLALLVLLVGLFPDFFGMLGRFIGFNIMSDLVIGVILVALIFLNIALTVMIASQRRRINIVSQEVALLKKELDDAKRKKS